ncbi:pentatricopeptide repeat-containing protein At3g57430, chloroplastic-like [Bidens hawaiensis]|uniref:pentatricopeptide repeat-containing protein At3g57430, chloroplastic-like n=1 Tax=Bidens hawaiensis TaxID=980011 RepID=UPI004049979A
MISCFGVHYEALNLFEKMKDSRFESNSVTLTAILASYSHSDLVNEGKKIVNSIRSSYSFEPSVEHYPCLVDLLSRVGCFEDALELINSMKKVKMVPPAGVSLAGSSVYKNIETCEIAVSHLFAMEPAYASNYIALCSIYESRGMWKDAYRVRLKIRRLRLDKTPGCSWILIGGETHTLSRKLEFLCW